MQQGRLLHGEHLPPRIAYAKLFSFLPEMGSPQLRGRPRTDPNALLRAFVYRCLRRLATLSDLAFALAENPSLAEAAGLDPLCPLPGVERLSAWLRNTPNEALQSVRIGLAQRLVRAGAVSGATLALDSCPVPSPVRENNRKTSVADRFNKQKPPANDPDARLGVYRCYGGPAKIGYFWGYRNHIAVDFHTELPLQEQTHPANLRESRFAVPLLEACQQLGLTVQAVCADSAYDSEKILSCIVRQLGARPIVASNARYQPNPEFRAQGDAVICPAGLEMVFKGRMTPKKTGFTYKQFCCPVHYRKKSLQRWLVCPAGHPKFFSQKGCNHLVRVNPSLRSLVHSGTAEFAALYQQRCSVERVFARLLSLAMQQPTVRGLRAVQNHCTLAHISVLLVAVAAHELGHQDKLAFVRSFVPRFLRAD